MHQLYLVALKDGYARYDILSDIDMNLPLNP
jgi:hypothetical protein